MINLSLMMTLLILKRVAKFRLSTVSNSLSSTSKVCSSDFGVRHQDNWAAGKFLHSASSCGYEGAN